MFLKKNHNSNFSAFHIMTLRKCLIKVFKIYIGGNPILATHSTVSPKTSTPALSMTLLFYWRMLFYYYNGELNVFRFDRDMRVLSWKKMFSKFLIFEKHQFVFTVHALVNSIFIRILIRLFPELQKDYFCPVSGFQLKNVRMIYLVNFVSI